MITSRPAADINHVEPSGNARKVMKITAGKKCVVRWILVVTPNNIARDSGPIPISFAPIKYLRQISALIAARTKLATDKRWLDGILCGLMVRIIAISPAPS